MHGLIIDDDRDTLLIIQSILAHKQIICTTLHDPTQIHTVLAHLTKPIDIVLLDLSLPDMNGYDMLAILRNQYHISAPIIACSGSHEEMAQTRDMGFDGFLGKPIRFDKLAERIACVVNGDEVWSVD